MSNFNRPFRKIRLPERPDYETANSLLISARRAMAGRRGVKRRGAKGVKGRRMY